MASFALPATLPSVTDEAWFPAPLQDRSSSDLNTLETAFRQKVRCGVCAPVYEGDDSSKEACVCDILLRFNAQLDADVAVDHIPLGMTREDFQSVCILKKTSRNEHVAVVLSRQHTNHGLQSKDWLIFYKLKIC